MAINRALRAVRESRGLELEAVAAAAKISSNSLIKIELGEKPPSRKQAERLSKIYGVPLYNLLSSSIPNLPPLPDDFRKPHPTPADLSPKGMTVLWASEQRAQFASQLITATGYEAPNFLKSLNVTDSPTQRAVQLRNIFDDWFMPREKPLQLAGVLEQRFLGGLRLFFEVQGNVVNSNDAPPEDYFGFYMKPAAATPVIFINRAIQSKKAQLFTLTHEISHWLLGLDGISNPFVLRNEIERTCNRFAAEFLAPMDRFRKLAESISEFDRSDVFRYVSAVSRSSLLSAHASAIRLVEGGYISQPKYRAWESVMARTPRAEKKIEQEEHESAGGQPHAKRLTEVGVLPVYLASEAIEEKAIDRLDVVAGIGLSETLQSKAFDLAKRRIEIARM